MKGILFKPESIKAIIEGRKTQTRRVIKPQPEWQEPNHELEWRGWIGAPECLIPYARYQVGEVVYVKEAWATEKRYDHLRPSETPHAANIFYVSDGVGEWPTNLSIGRLRSPLHLTEKCARYFIKITGVRAERLQEITEEDAKAEGCDREIREGLIFDSALHEYSWLWDSLNPKYPWEMDPWVWVYSLEKV